MPLKLFSHRFPILFTGYFPEFRKTLKVIIHTFYGISIHQPGKINIVMEGLTAVTLIVHI